MSVWALAESKEDSCQDQKADVESSDKKCGFDWVSAELPSADSFKSEERNSLLFPN